MDNSASLLLRILEEGRSKKPETPAANVFRDILEVQSINGLVGALGEFFSLVEKAANDVLSVHPDKDGVDYWRIRIYNGFHSQALGQPWAGFKNQIDEITIFTLRSHAKILEMHKPQKGLSIEEIEQSRNIFEEALQFLNSATIDAQIRTILLSRIEQIQSLLTRYKFVGPDALLDAAKILAAELASVPKEQADAVKKSGAYSKIKEGLEVVANATQVASATPYLLASGSYLLSLLT